MRLLPFCSPSRRMARRGGRDRLHGPFKHLQSLVLCTSFSYTTEYFIVWLVFFMLESCVGLWMLGSFAKWGGDSADPLPCSPKWYCLAGLYQNTSVNPRSNDSKTWHLSCGQMWDVLLAHCHDGEKKSIKIYCKKDDCFVLLLSQFLIWVSFEFPVAQLSKGSFISRQLWDAEERRAAFRRMSPLIRWNQAGY